MIAALRAAACVLLCRGRWLVYSSKRPGRLMCRRCQSVRALR